MEIFDYDNILLLPRKCRVESRSDCDTSVQFGAHRFKLPVVPANMKTVVDEAITEQLAAEALDELAEVDEDEAVVELPPDDEGGPES
jgi:hypothetical protein